MESIARALFNLALELLFLVGLTRNLSLEKKSYSLLFFFPTRTCSVENDPFEDENMIISHSSMMKPIGCFSPIHYQKSVGHNTYPSEMLEVYELLNNVPGTLYGANKY